MNDVAFIILDIVTPSVYTIESFCHQQTPCGEKLMDTRPIRNYFIHQTVEEKKMRGRSDMCYSSGVLVSLQGVNIIITKPNADEFFGHLSER